jgi:ABC-type sugar transport system substrate-binding protein
MTWTYRGLAVVCVTMMLGCGGGQPRESETAQPQPASPGDSSSTAASPSSTDGEAPTDYPRPSKPARQYRLGVVIPHLSNPFFVGQAYGYIDEAQQLGANVTLLEAGGYQYLDRQIAQMEDLIASRVDAIILVAINGPGTVSVVDDAVAAGIPVINCNVMTDNEKVVSRIRSDDDVIGRMHGDFMGQRLGGKGNVVMLRGAPGTSWAENRGNAFKQRLAEKFPNVKIVAEQYSQSTPADGLRLMEDFLQTVPQIDGVYNGSDTTAIGAAQALVASNRQGKTVVTATDFQIDTEKFMREGVITLAVLQAAVTIGRWGVRAAINHLEKQPVPKALFTPLLTVTREQLDSVDMQTVRAPAGWKPPTR